MITSFGVKILNDKNGSWQGVLYCENNEEITFRSALELLTLMDEKTQLCAAEQRKMHK